MYDIAIVGYGPVGATAANLLGQYGLTTLVIERDAAIFDQPRAIGFDHEVMRVFQSAGLADAVLPHTGSLRSTIYTGARDQVIRRFQHVPPPFPYGWFPNYTFDQPGLEAALRRGAESREAVAVLLRHEMTSLAQHDDHVEIALRDLDGAQERTVRAKYLIGCDGSKSTVRRLLDIPLEDMDFDEPWIVIDVYARDVDRLPQTNIQFCDPKRPKTYIVGPGSHRRWELMLLEGETPEEMSGTAKILELLSRWGGAEDFEIRRSAVYRFHALVAAQWRKDRVLLMGDAAHQTPPFIGQGMCQGIRDAANLAWKLKAVLRDGAPPALLDSYQSERKPHVEVTTQRTKALGQEICLRDPDAARERDEALQRQLDAGQMDTIRQNLIPGLSDGVIDRRPDGTPAPDAGGLALQPTVRSPDGADRLLDDAIGPRFALVFNARPAHAPLDPEWLRIWSAVGGRILNLVQGDAGDAAGPAAGPKGATTLEDVDGLLSSHMTRQGIAALIIRPDRYVFGAAGTDAELGSLVQALEAHIWGKPIPGRLNVEDRIGSAVAAATALQR